jgi:CxxC-x17-CxxC domain-containing protein
MKEFRRPSGQGAGRSSGIERREQSSGSRSPRPSFGGDRAGYGNHKGDFNSGERREIKHTATCSECNNTCEVPFRPNGSKPVYCKDCFGKKKGAQGNSNYEKRDFAPQAHTSREERVSAPVRDTRIDELKAQVDSMQSKLDRILRAMETAKVAEVVKTEKIEKTIAPVAKVEMKKATVVSVKKPVAVAAKPLAKVAKTAAKPVAKKKK